MINEKASLCIGVIITSYQDAEVRYTDMKYRGNESGVSLFSLSAGCQHNLSQDQRT